MLLRSRTLGRRGGGGGTGCGGLGGREEGNGAWTSKDLRQAPSDDLRVDDFSTFKDLRRTCRNFMFLLSRALLELFGL